MKPCSLFWGSPIEWSKAVIFLGYLIFWKQDFRRMKNLHVAHLKSLFRQQRPIQYQLMQLCQRPCRPDPVDSRLSDCPQVTVVEHCEISAVQTQIVSGCCEIATWIVEVSGQFQNGSVVRDFSTDKCWRAFEQSSQSVLF